MVRTSTVRVCLTVFGLLCSAAASAADWSGSARGQISGGVDTNPGREFISDGGNATPDAFVQGIVNLAGGVAGGPFAVDGTYDVGARKFITQYQQNTVVQSATLLATAFLPHGFSLNLEGRARDRRGADRDYTDLVANLVLAFAPDNQLDFRLRGGYHRFLFWAPGGFRESFYAPEAGLNVRYRFNKHHAFNAFGEFSYRTFNSNQYCSTDQTAPMPCPAGSMGDGSSILPIDGTVRHDPYFLAGIAYNFKGPVNLTLSYAYLDNWGSDTVGEAYRQHRIGLVVGVALPWELTAVFNGQLRFSTFRDGMLVDPVIPTLNDDENISSVSVKLVRPIGEHVDIDLRYAFYYGVLPSKGDGTMPDNDFLYVRHVASLGVSVRF
jgi:hypothetical protein